MDCVNRRRPVGNGWVGRTNVRKEACAWDMKLEQAIRKLYSELRQWNTLDRLTSHAAYSYNFFHLGDAMFVC